jgi:hypothetical protein
MPHFEDTVRSECWELTIKTGALLVLGYGPELLTRTVRRNNRSDRLNGFRGNRVKILDCGNKLIEMFRELSQGTTCAPLRYPRTGKVLPSQDGVHCRQKFPIRIWLENVPFGSVA